MKLEMLTAEKYHVAGVTGTNEITPLLVLKLSNNNVLLPLRQRQRSSPVELKFFFVRTENLLRREEGC